MKRKGPKPIMATSQEIAISFWLTACVFGVMLLRLKAPVEYDFMVVMMLIFSFISTGFLCYLFSKYNLNVFTDKIHPDYEFWIRLDKTKMATLQIARKDSLGLSKGIAHGAKAALINRGDYTISSPNGNKGLLVFDTMSHNLNLEEAMGWRLIKRKWGFIGYSAYEKALKEGGTLIEVPSKKETTDEEGRKGERSIS